MIKEKFGFGLAGIILGLLGVTFFFVLELFGPRSYTASGSIALTIGEPHMEVSNPLISQLARVTFYTLFLPVLLSLLSFSRGEYRVASWGALVFGLSPVFLYTLGSIITPLILYAVSFPILVVAMYRRVSKHNN